MKATLDQLQHNEVVFLVDFSSQYQLKPLRSPQGVFFSAASTYLFPLVAYFLFPNQAGVITLHRICLFYASDDNEECAAWSHQAMRHAIAKMRVLTGRHFTVLKVFSVRPTFGPLGLCLCECALSSMGGGYLCDYALSSIYESGGLVLASGRITAPITSSWRSTYSCAVRRPSIQSSIASIGSRLRRSMARYCKCVP